jgi:hypothetical protein
MVERGLQASGTEYDEVSLNNLVQVAESYEF